MKGYEVGGMSHGDRLRALWHDMHDDPRVRQQAVRTSAALRTMARTQQILPPPVAPTP